MNIFVISASPIECAQALDDKRIIKMALETAQILSTALSIRGYEEAPYPPLYPRHPCVKWAAENLANWEWLFAYLGELNHEYKRRFLKNTDMPSVARIRESDVERIAQTLLPKGSMTEFPNCSGVPDLPVFEAYKALLRIKWSDNRKNTARWTKTHPPAWNLPQGE